MTPTNELSNAFRLVERISRVRVGFIYFIDALCVAVALTLAFMLRFDFSLTPHYSHLLASTLWIWILTKAGVFSLFRIQRQSWRHTSLHDLLRLMGSNVTGSLIAYMLVFGFTGFFPRSIWIIELILCVCAMACFRAAVRLLMEITATQAPELAKCRAVIYGAGEAGVALLREIRQNGALMYDVRGFIDDARPRLGLTVHGVRVLGDGSALPQIAAKHGISLVLIAIPSASGPQITRILGLCHAARLKFKTVPSLAEVIEGRGLAPQIRDIAVEDLLGRSPVYLEEDLISGKISNSTVLVTGAAGSIGSELCRQIARFGPAAVIGFDASETPLFHLQQEMARSFPGIVFHAAVGSIQSAHRLADLFQRYRPAVVYHAAAYKHVPMMENHAFEAVENNVFGTLNVSLAAKQYGVRDFIMISSDKAVRPTNVMGASKRLAELVVRSLQGGQTRCVSVRFGNVLGSNGSVVPIFKQQIALGGPITITHPDMRRYFMTIPEACQLVLQSSTMGKGGEIFVLDMGEPVRITDLARNLILLSGLRPDEDIKIEFTGIRPGEKLSEELNTFEEDTVPTCHEKIKIFAGCNVRWSIMETRLKELEVACAFRNLDELILILKDLVPEYNPSSELLRRAFERKPLVMAGVG
jgi:FlaA1/EpsC-like NDP-sugar epimerase